MREANEINEVVPKFIEAILGKTGIVVIRRHHELFIEEFGVGGVWVPIRFVKRPLTREQDPEYFL